MAALLANKPGHPPGKQVEGGGSPGCRTSEPKKVTKKDRHFCKASPNHPVFTMLPKLTLAYGAMIMPVHFSFLKRGIFSSNAHAEFPSFRHAVLPSE